MYYYTNKSTRFDWVTSVLARIYKVGAPWDQKDAFDTLFDIRSFVSISQGFQQLLKQQMGDHLMLCHLVG